MRFAVLNLPLESALLEECRKRVPNYAGRGPRPDPILDDNVFRDRVGLGAARSMLDLPEDLSMEVAAGVNLAAPSAKRALTIGLVFPLISWPVRLAVSETRRVREVLEC